MKDRIYAGAFVSLVFVALVVTGLTRSRKTESIASGEPAGLRELVRTEAPVPVVRLDVLAGRREELFRRHRVGQGAAAPASKQELASLILQNTPELRATASPGRADDDPTMKEAINSMREHDVSRLRREIERARTSEELAAAIVAFHRKQRVSWSDSLDRLKPVYVRAAFSESVMLRDATRSALERLSPDWDSLVPASSRQSFLATSAADARTAVAPMRVMNSTDDDEPRPRAITVSKHVFLVEYGPSLLFPPSTPTSPYAATYYRIKADKVTPVYDKSDSSIEVRTTAATHAEAAQALKARLTELVSNKVR